LDLAFYFEYRYNKKDFRNGGKTRMPILVLFIVLSITFYVFYKVKQVRSNRPMEKKWLSSKASIALGLFVLLFGVNQLFLYHTTSTYFIAAIFIILGGFSIWGGYKSYQHNLPYARREAEELNQSKE
jgi:predicted Abi (CAAX) family protease